MSGFIPVMPVEDLRSHILFAMIAARDKGDTALTHLLVSMSEYLKDAQRWRYFMQNGPVLDDLSSMTPDDLLRWVDAKLGITP